MLLADTVVSAIGQASRPELVDWGIDIDDSGRTNLAYVYAGGDVVNGGASVVQAVAEGRRAARVIEEDLCAT